MSEPAPLATVVIVNWNGAHLIGPCLEALAKQTEKRFVTWVVDNASTDGSLELLARDHPEVRVLRNTVNKGFAGGNNTALHEVTSPFSVLLNNDARPEPDWLERLLAPFSASGSERLGAVTAKVLFEPRFLRLELATEGFVPGAGDPRDLGVRIGAVTVDGDDVTERVLWERLTWGPEGEGAARFRWTRPSGELLVPLPSGEGPRTVTIRWAAERTKPASLTWDGGSAQLAVTEGGGEARLDLPAGVPTVDVINNAGSVVLAGGYGADRGYQETDLGQYGSPEPVFAMCGCAVAFRTVAGHELGWFDDDFFLYYEDTDLSWRLQAHGWSIRYEPTAVVRHIHAATSVEWSPRFVFHTDRNRLLMLTKNATAQLTLREVGRYPLTTASLALRALRQASVGGGRPAVRPTLLRLRVIASYLRLLPGMLAKRRALAAGATVGPASLERNLQATR
ncbi:MAG: glycosyltransferase [Actinomycetota bacterium]|nr:glycosyltransferase [Actinomycetota bacterium]